MNILNYLEAISDVRKVHILLKYNLRTTYIASQINTFTIYEYLFAQFRTNSSSCLFLLL